MNPKRQKLEHKHQQQAETTAQQQQATGQAALEFKLPEDLLRHDAGRTRVPGNVEDRLVKSIQSTPREEKSWWQRVLGR